MSDPKEIFLMPECCADNEGRLWSEHDAPIDCEDGNPWTRYVRADEIERLQRELAEAHALLREAPGMQWKSDVEYADWRGRINEHLGGESEDNR